MTEQRQSSPIELFRPSASPSPQASLAYGSQQSNEPKDMTFSRELSRANDRSRDRVTDSHSRKEASKSAQKSDNNQSEARSDEPIRSSTENSRASAKSGRDKRVSDSDNRSDAKVVEHAEGKTAGEKSVENKSTADGDDRLAVASEPVHNSEETTNTDDQADGKLKTLINAGALPDSDQSGDTAGKFDLVESTAQGNENAALLNTNQADGSEMPSQLLEANGMGVSGLATNNSSVTKPDSVALKNGEQLSSVQLASRQAQLAKNASMRTQPQAEVSAISVKDVSANAAADAKPVSVVDTATMLAQRAMTSGVPTGNGTQLGDSKSKNGKGSSTGASGAQTLSVLTDKSVTGERAGSSPVIMQQTAEQTVGGEANKRLQQAELQAVADMNAKLVAQKAEQQTIKANLAQVQQLALQQTQTSGLATPVLMTESGAGTTQSADNMFLPLPGGIVTAPVLQRVDAASAQAINAPLNLSILDNDAEKAMTGNIRWMVNEGVKNAVVNVTPSGMGPISVSIGMEKDQMNVSIVALQGSTREALDSMLPRLREQLAAQGHDSVKVDISDGRAEQSGRGYGQQFSDGNQSFEQNAELADSNGEADISKTTETENSTDMSQGLLQVNGDTNSRSRYDVYV